MRVGRIPTPRGCTTPASRCRSATTWRTPWKPAPRCSTVGRTPRTRTCPPAIASIWSRPPNACRTRNVPPRRVWPRPTTHASRRCTRRTPLRDGISESRPQRFKVERPKSSFAAWYQFFPRSEGAYRAEDGTIVQGNFKTALTGLDRAAEEGFDIVYLPPIFPIGVTNRKGRNNSLVAGPHDPGSPFGIGSELGGHDTVDPLLGTMDDFKAFVAHAHELGLEIALDFALQCSPDHPWVKQHPNWFRIKPDGTIAFAENPPKKYQDIYPIDFNADMPGIEREVERIMNLWIEAGVTIFRIDNPHTKPVRFWQDVIAAVTKKHPEVLFLAEAFTRPGHDACVELCGLHAVALLLPVAQHQGGAGRVPARNQRQRRLLPAQHLLAHHAGHPDRLRARQRHRRPRRARGAGRHGIALVGHLQRLRADREPPAPRDSRSRSTTRSTRSRSATGRKRTSTASPNCSVRSTRSAATIRPPAATTTSRCCRPRIRASWRSPATRRPS